jgi:competence protein ComFB
MIGGIMSMLDASSRCMTRNANYDRVMNVVGAFLSGRYSHSCGCFRCVSDIAAIALNVLPPHYYVEAENSGIAGSPWVMVENAVVEAIERVMENPRHEARSGGHVRASVCAILE